MSYACQKLVMHVKNELWLSENLVRSAKIELACQEISYACQKWVMIVKNLE